MTLGGGKIGFLALIISLTVYMTLSKPPNPSPTPTTPPNATGINQTAIR